jgi:hypothetical protein
MKTLITFIGQSNANLIIKKMQRCKTQETLDYWFNKGAKLNNLMVSFEIYLD